MKHLSEMVLTFLVCGALGAGIAVIGGAAWDWLCRPKKTKVQP